MAAVVAGSLITGAFGEGVKEISNLVKNFDWSKIKVTDKKSNEFLHTGLAPSYGKLDKDGLQKIDDELKIMIAGTMKVLEKQSDKSWKAVVETMMKNQFVEPDKDETYKTDTLTKESKSVFKTDGSPSAKIVDEVKTWFTKLISDSDVLASTKIDIDVLAKIVAQSGATIDSFETFWAKTERHEQTVLDIGVLRFPDMDRPYFKLYRIELKAWSDCSRIVFHQTDANGITGTFNARIFRPRESVLKGMNPGPRKKAIDEANNMFS